MRMQSDSGDGGWDKKRVLTPVNQFHDEKENPEEDEEKYKAGQEARARVKDWCGSTTMHGVSHAVSQDTWTPYRITWLVIVLLALIGIIYQLTTVLITFTSYPTAEVTTYNTNPPKFPFVTFCNQLAPSMLHEHEVLNDTSSSLYQYVQLIDDNLADLLAYEAETGIAMDDILLSPTGIFQNLDTEDIQAVGHQIEDFILRCTYMGIECDLQQDFKRYMDSAFFNCYTFTGEYVTSGLDIGSGPSHGLSLVFYTESATDSHGYTLSAFKYNVYSNIQNGMGIRIEIHDGDELPNPQDAGIDVMPGTSTSFAMQATEIIKLSHPYGECTDRNNLKSVSGYKYSQARCIDECTADFIYNKCGCATAIYPITKHIKSHSNYQYCAKFNASMSTSELLNNIECESKYLLRFHGDRSHRTKCGCKEPCDYLTYDEIITSSKWPAPIYGPDMYNEYVLAHENFENLTAYIQLNDVMNDDERRSDAQKLIWHNFVRVNLYFQDVIIRNIEEQALYGWDTLFSNVGGTFGLWAGLSCITFIEVGFLLGSLIMICVKKCKQMRSNANKVNA